MSDASWSGSPQSLPEGQQAILARIQPFLETMVLVMMVDREAAESERQAVRGALSTLTQDALGDAVLTWMLDGFEAARREHGVEARLQQLGAQLSADRDDAELAFTLAAAVTLADDRVAIEERMLMTQIAGWFGLSDEHAQRILEEVAEVS